MIFGIVNYFRRGVEDVNLYNKWCNNIIFIVVWRDLFDELLLVSDLLVMYIKDKYLGFWSLVILFFIFLSFKDFLLI